MIKIISSPRSHALVRRLSLGLEGEGHPFSDDIVIVQSKGMAKWVSLALAAEKGISSGVNFVFPRGFVGEVLRSCGLLKDLAPFQRPSMLWNLFQHWPELAEEHAEIAKYIEFDGEHFHASKGYALAQQLSNLFDNYMVFRPEWIEHWEQGLDETSITSPHQAWQKACWRAMNLSVESSFTGAIRQFCQDPERFRASIDFSKIHIFGISSLPPLYLDFFMALAKLVEVDNYQVSPCLAYWADIRKQGPMSSNDEPGHPLLASWGVLGRDFQHLLLQRNLDASGDEAYDEPIEADTNLKKLQESILNLESDVEWGSDRSLEIHSCYSAKREVEVCLDQVYEQIQKGVQPHEILVMSTALDDHLPFIESVFSHPSQGLPRLPFSIADRPSRETNGCAALLEQLFKVSKGRFAASDIMGILEHPVTMEQFDIDSTKLQQIRSCIERSGFRWGRDALHREHLGLPRFTENSWLFSLKRWLLGLCYHDERVYQGQVSCPLEEGEREALSVLVDVGEKLWHHFQQCSQKQSPKMWIKCVQECLETFFPKSREREEQVKAIRDACEAFYGCVDQVDISEKIPLYVFESSLWSHLDEEESSHGFLQGGITFSRLLPMRSLPFKMIAILGLNEGVFPRSSPRCGFDLMAQQPKRDDRSMRLDDRYIFLESVMAAEQKLHLSYVGQSIKDDARVPPSTLVSELIDFGKTTDKEFPFPIQRHPLQAYSARYFSTTSHVFSYSKDDYEAAQQHQHSEQLPKFHQQALELEPLLEEGCLKLTPDRVVRFFKNPSQSYLKIRLGAATFDEEEAQLEDDEPFDFGDGLARYLTKQKLLNHLLKSKVSHHVDDVIETLAKQGHWPVGFKGEDHLRQEYLNLKPFAEVVQSELGTETMHQDIKFKLDVDGIQVELEGNVKTYGSDKLVHYRHTNIKHKDRISALVHHLIANVQNKNIETVLMGWDKKKNLTERFTYHADDSKDDMEALLKLVIKGLKQPLPFFPETSLAIKKGGSYSMSAWKGGYMSTGERDDNAVSMCFGRDYPGHDEDISEAFYNISAELLSMLEKWEVQS